jgi:beta-lactamase regulating signal transducer with metallopeptidase domain
MDMIFGTINSFGKVFVGFALPMLVQSSIVIGIFLLAERLLREKVRAVFRYWLGMLIFVQLILPPLLISRVNLGYLSDAGDVSQSTASPVVTWQGIVFLVWLAVVVVMGVLLLKRMILAGRHIRQAKKANLLMNDLLVYCCKCMGVNSRKVRLRISSDGTSPAVCGLFRPVILVPNNLAPSLGSRHLRAVLLHELAHIKRGDLWANWAQTILQIIYFYNPLLWLANSTICRIREQAVDETVLAAMGQKIQRYPEMLADVARLIFNRPALSLGLIGVVESQDTLVSRIKSNLYPLLRKSA